MKYEEFNYYISRLKEVQDFDNELGELSRKYSNLLYDNYLVPVVLADDYIRLLEIVLGIHDELISWWIYETEYGKNFKIGDLEDPNAIEPELKTPDLSTTEKLFEYIKLLQEKGIYKFKE